MIGRGEIATYSWWEFLHPFHLIFFLLFLDVQVLSRHLNYLQWKVQYLRGDTKAFDRPLLFLLTSDTEKLQGKSLHEHNPLDLIFRLSSIGGK